MIGVRRKVVAKRRGNIILLIAKATNNVDPAVRIYNTTIKLNS
jgi:hypothetical protein